MAYKIKNKKKADFIKQNFMLIPTNEGQEINYIEDFRGTFKQAKQRAKLMKIKLQNAMPQGTIDVKILDSEARDVGAI